MALDPFERPPEARRDRDPDHRRGELTARGDPVSAPSSPRRHAPTLLEGERRQIQRTAIVKRLSAVHDAAFQAELLSLHRLGAPSTKREKYGAGVPVMQMRP